MSKVITAKVTALQAELRAERKAHKETREVHRAIREKLMAFSKPYFNEHAFEDEDLQQFTLRLGTLLKAISQRSI